MSEVAQLKDKAAERAVLAGIFKYGEEAFYDVVDLLQAETFTVNSNRVIYQCLKHKFDLNKDFKPDIASVLSAAKELKLDALFEKNVEVEHLNAITQFPVSLTNVRAFAAKIRKLQIGRLLHTQLEEAQVDILSLQGVEPIAQIMGMVEDRIFDFSSLINDIDNEPKLLATGIDDYLQNLIDNPVTQIGIPTGLPEYDKAIGGGLRRGTVNVIGARPKALAYGEKVYTPTGPRNIEDILVGDIVSHPFKGYSKVTEVHDHKREIYKVTFKDGDSVDCCEDHLWEVYKRYPYGDLNSKPYFVKTTTELMQDLTIGNQKEYKWDVRLTEPVRFDKTQVLPLDPYILGLLIGDGSFRNAISFTTGDIQLIDYIRNNLPNEIKVEEDKVNFKTYRINGLQDSIRKCGLYRIKAHSKFIPDMYKYTSLSNRLEILRGLMDTDGDCTVSSKTGLSRCRFATVSIKLANDVKEIVQSLGGLCSINLTSTRFNGKSFTSYRCEIRLPKYNPFKLERKAVLVKERQPGELKRTIIKIEKLGYQDRARCLTLSDNDGLFLTTNFVVTHNTGKTMLTDNIGYHVANNEEMPVLNMDTEMKGEDHVNRSLAMLSGVAIDDIETGQFGKDQWKLKKVKESASQLKKVPYFHKSIAGAEFQEIIATMRRWLVKEVGLNGDGKANECVIVYDYLKLMDSKEISGDIKEYQLLGFMMTALHNFAVRYDVPILVLMQLNRDGIDSEKNSAAAGSDRIIWLCSNFTIFKKKSDEEIAEDGPENGTHKLIVTDARHGSGMQFGDYLNLHVKGWCAQIKTGLLRSQVGQELARKGFNPELDEGEHIAWES